MTDESVKTTETKSKYTSDIGNGEVKTKEVTTEKKTTDTDTSDKTIILTTTED